MYSDTSEPRADSATIRTAMMVRTMRVRREIAGTGSDGRMATTGHSWRMACSNVLRTNMELTGLPSGSRAAGQDPACHDVPMSSADEAEHPHDLPAGDPADGSADDQPGGGRPANGLRPD